VSARNILGLIGWPISHSLSPAMHNAALKAVGLSSWSYVGLPVEPEQIKEAVFGLRALGFRGANVTVPHKEAVLAFLDNLSPTAQAIGAVNTIIIEDNRLLGDNTDAPGFINDLREKGLKPEELSVAVLGAGGSARAIIHALISINCPKILILNRSKEKADNLITNFNNPKLSSLDFSRDSIKRAASCDLIINCTSLGLKAGSEKLPWDKDVSFSKGQCVYDVIYNPAKSQLLAKAEAEDARIINGLGMLVQQAALSFSMWTGINAPISIMKTVAEQALKP
jgi:shikimate dehydrogenase